MYGTERFFEQYRKSTFEAAWEDWVSMTRNPCNHNFSIRWAVPFNVTFVTKKISIVLHNRLFEKKDRFDYAEWEKKRGREE